MVLTQASFSDLLGWEEDDHSAAIAAFLKSCFRIERWSDERMFDAGGIGGRVGDWRPLCVKARSLPSDDRILAREFFEDGFEPFAVAGNNDRDGLFTGYYEPIIKGSREQSKRFAFPLYARPTDLISVDLGLFRPELRGRTISGRLVGDHLLPYDTRGEIEAGALKGQNIELLWVDDKIDAFFLHIQGSGQVRLRDGNILRVGFAGKNGRPYTSIGRKLVERGAIDEDMVSMPAIRNWLINNPVEAPSLMELNESYIFFKILSGGNLLGAQGTILTPGRSLAVDRAFIPLGVPVWLSTTVPEPDGTEGSLQILVITQDTGSAIVGPVRGDVFWGPGPEAERIAGSMQNIGRYWLLLPRTLSN